MAKSVLLCGALSASAALAAPARSAPAPALSIASPSPVLEPGSTVVVRWKVPDGFDEMELVLSVDGGRTFPLRVTRRIAPSDAGFSWTVPSLPAVHARLALRAGVDEEEDSETIVGLSDDFAIAPSAQRGVEELFQVGDEERTREALESVPPLPAGPALGGVPSLNPGRDLPEATGPNPAPDSHLRRVRSTSDPSAAGAATESSHPSPSPGVASIRLPMRL